MAELIGGGRALQVCDACGGVDDHPRHHAAGGQPDQFEAPSPGLVRAVAAATAELEPAVADRLMAELLDTGTSSRHLDCCAAAGCPSCAVKLAGWDGTPGAGLLAHLVRGGVR